MIMDKDSEKSFFNIYQNSEKIVFFSLKKNEDCWAVEPELCNILFSKEIKLLKKRKENNNKKK